MIPEYDMINNPLMRIRVLSSKWVRFYSGITFIILASSSDNLEKQFPRLNFFCLFDRLNFSVRLKIYTDDKIISPIYRLIITSCCLYCRTNRLRRLVRLSINTAIMKQCSLSISDCGEIYRSYRT